METNPKILIATPTSQYKDYCVEDWSKSISSLTYPNLDILILDNSEDKEHVHTFTKYKFRPNTFLMHVPKKETDKNLCYLMARCNEISRVFALKNNYDYILSIESDIFAPHKDCVQELLSHNVDVVGYNYFISQLYKSSLVNYISVNPNFIVQENVITFEDIYNFINIKNRLQEVESLGLGFILIKRNVFSEIPFRVSEDEFSKEHHADTFYHLDIKRKGVIVWCDNKHILTHRNTGWGNINLNIN